MHTFYWQKSRGVYLLGRLYKKKSCPGKKGSPAYPSYPERANLSFISLQNTANHLNEKQKVGLDVKVTLPQSPYV